jgi:hypothetical protein
MTKDEYIEWATEIIAAGVELMPLDQLSKWEGVRAWQELADTVHDNDQDRA